MVVYKTLDNGMRFVEYEPCFAAGIADMWNKSGEGWGGDATVTTERQVLLQHTGGSFFNVYLALETNGEIVGYCSFDRYYKDADTAYVHTLNVRPDYHGKKVGKELVLLCVNRAIELGYPRLDIHTWPGNTKAVPLYKKCGFLWEDRADSTHLANFIPTVLKAELTAGFFENADWYSDSSRIIEIKPDGVKLNKFEVFGYSWEKDGQSLAVGFEKTGRRMRLIETNDYRLELIAQNHELAFGLSYDCVFTAVNKTGKPLSIKINGKDDEKIKFDFSAEDEVSGTKEFKGSFTVCEVTEPQDIWRMHPCLLADVWVNGRRAEFGLGIEIKFPLNVTLSHMRSTGRAGIVSDVYINIESGLLSDAEISFALPDCKLSKFSPSSFTAKIPAKGRVMLSTSETTLAEGFEALAVNYGIKLANGESFSFTKPLYITNQGFGGAFAFDEDACFGIINGPWRLAVYKNNNHASFRRFDKTGNADMPAPKLGKPFDDEFNLAAPAEIRRFADGFGYMLMEVDYRSDKFEGIVLTQRFKINASGLCERSHSVTNSSQKPQELWLLQETWTSVGRRSVFRYDGGYIGLEDNLAYGFADTHPEKFEENWIFNNQPDNRAGIYWPPECKPTMKWGDMLIFEHDLGELAPGQRAEVAPVVYACGLFKDARSFRNYVLGEMEQRPPHTRNHIELEANGHNPFISGEEINFKLRNNYLTVNGGTVTLCSDGLFDSVTAENPATETVPLNEFSVSAAKTGEAVHIAAAKLRFLSCEKDMERALFMITGDEVKTSEKDGVYTTDNGKLAFCAAPSFSDALFSLKYEGREWLYTRYPAVEPYAWWNPFIGGIQSFLPNMNVRLVLREKITACFAERKDNFGNVWTGIKTTVEISECEEWKGMALEQYFLTAPGVPVVCSYCRVINNTGVFKDFRIDTQAFFSGKEGLGEYRLHFRDAQSNAYLLKAGSNDEWYGYEKLVKVSREGSEPHGERLYFYKNAARDCASSSVAMDINSLQAGLDSCVKVKDGETAATLPLFVVLSEKELTAESLSELDYIQFD